MGLSSHLFLSCFHRMRRHLEAQRNYQAKLNAIKTAIDAWMVKAQAIHRLVPFKGGDGSSSSSNVCSNSQRDKP